MVAIHEKPSGKETPLRERPIGSVWARTPLVHAEVIRQVARETNDINVDQALTGLGVNLIVDDDMNALVTVDLARQAAILDARIEGFTPEKAEQAFIDLDTRMEFELQETQLPQPIKERLGEVKDMLRIRTFPSAEAKFNSVYTEWRNFRFWVRQEIDQYPELKAAREYARGVIERIQEQHQDKIDTGMNQLSHV